MAKYKVLGTEGEEVEVNGNTYGGGVGTKIELSDTEAADALAAGKIELVTDEEEVDEEVSDEETDEDEEEEVA